MEISSNRCSFPPPLPSMANNRSPDDLRFHPGRLRLRLQILRERARWLDAQPGCGRNRAATSSGSKKQSGEKIDNVVFMGMGEPLANFKNLVRAIRIINAPWGLGIGARHITVSTSGLAPQIRELAAEPLQFRLALSLHGATDDVRSQIMPVNRKYNSRRCSRHAITTSRASSRIMFEYILIAEVNDTDEQAHALAKHAARLSAKINLIPYNTVEGLEWSRPSRARQERFHSILRGQDRGNPSPRKRPRYRRGLRSAPFANEARCSSHCRGNVNEYEAFAAAV